MVGATPDLQVGRPHRGPRPASRGCSPSLWVLAGDRRAARAAGRCCSTPTPRSTGCRVVFELVGGSFAISGLVAWRRRPDSLTGVLMTATGFAFFISPPAAPGRRPRSPTRSEPTVRPHVDLLLRRPAAHPADPAAGSSRGRPLGRRRPTPSRSCCSRSPGCCSATSTAGQPPARVARRRLAHVARPAPARASLAACVAIVVRDHRPLAARARRRAGGRCCRASRHLHAAAVRAPARNDLSPAAVADAAVDRGAARLTVPAALLGGLLRSRLARGGLADLFRGLALRGGDLRRRSRRRSAIPGARSPTGCRTTRSTSTPAAAVAPPPPAATARSRRSSATAAQLAVLVLRRLARRRSGARRAPSPRRRRSRSRTRGCTPSRRRGSPSCKASRERIVAAGDAERRRLERNLHDGAQQRLVGIALQLRLLQRRLRDDPSRASSSWRPRATSSPSRSQELRELARGIHPAVLEHGLDAALGSLARALAGADRPSTSSPAGRLPSRSSSPPTSSPPRR